jgi:uncharacterized hydrophobic protein (TIGR00271 family)
MWLVIGLFGLYRDVQSLTGRSAGWAYLTVVLVSLPAVLSYLELRSWVGHSGGSYRLIRTLERNNITFFAGWAYLLGWAGLSAYLLQSFAYYTYQLLSVGWSPPIGELPIAVAGLALFTLFNFIGSRSPWRISVYLLGSAILSVLVMLALFILRVVRLVPGLPDTTGGGNFFGAVTILVAALWTIELMSEMGDRRHRNLQTTFVLLLGGPLLGGFVLLVSRWGNVSATSVEALAEAALPGIGRVAILGVGVVVTGITWGILSLIMLRRFQIIGLDGWLPPSLLRSYSRFKTPLLLIALQSGLTLVALLAAHALSGFPADSMLVGRRLAGLAALAYLVIQIGVNAAAIMLARHPRAVNRSFVLPLYPIIPATGIAICFLLILAIPWPVLLVGFGWFAAGALVFWQVGLEGMRESQLGITVFQDLEHKPDVTSDYPVVVPVANPDTAHGLVAFGARVARYYGGHLSIVMIHLVPEQLPLESGRSQAQEKLDLLEQVITYAESFGVPVEGITRLARNIPQGILDTISEESAQLVVMGWNARNPDEQAQGLGHILDEILENAACDVAVLKGDWSQEADTVVVPVAGGPHAPRAADLALALTADGSPLTLLNVVRESDGASAVEEAESMLLAIRQELHDPLRVLPTVVKAPTPLAGIVQAADEHDAILLGASEIGVLDRQLFGELPLQIAAQSEARLALVRGYTGLTKMVARKAWSSISDLLPTLTFDEQMEVYHELRRASRPSINYFVLIAASAVIATLGLLLNSPAVIIGAMLVAPLMSPIVSAGMGIVTGDIQMLRSALSSTLQGVLLAIFLGIVSTLISPLATATTEVLARTRPNLLDLLVALVSGVAGAYAIGRKEVGAALPGVAIAAALVPPIAAIGVGIALGSLSVALGAALLFTTNLVAIIFSSAITFLLLGMRPPRRPDRQRWLRQGLIVSVVLLLLISIPLGVVLFQAASVSRIEGQAQEIVQQTVDEWSSSLTDGGRASLADFNVDAGWRNVSITGTLYTTEDISSADMNALDARLESALHRTVDIELFVVQGVRLKNGDQP